MKPNRKIFIASGAIILLAALAVLAGWAWSLANRPLQPSLSDLATLAFVKATDSLAAEAAVTTATQLPSPEHYNTPMPAAVLPTPTAAGDSKTICGGPALMFIQVAGIDHNNLADAIRIVRIDFARPQVSVLAIERATWVSIPHLEDHGITSFLVNAAHSYGNLWLGKDGGAYLLSETIAQNFGIQSDHYLEINLDSFVTAIDMVGGVDVNLPDGAYDPLATKLDLSPGMHHLDGKTAQILARMRYSDSDWQRIDRQTLLAVSLFKQLTSPEMLPWLPGLVSQADGIFTTDLSPVEISQLVCLAAELPNDAIKFYKIGPDMVTSSTLKDETKTQVMLPKYDLIRPYITQFINGSLP